VLGPDGLVWRFNTFCFGRLPKSSELRELLEKLDVDPLWRVGEYPPSLFRDAESAASREFDESRPAQIALRPVHSIGERVVWRPDGNSAERSSSVKANLSASFSTASPIYVSPVDDS